MQHGWLNETVGGHKIEHIPCPNPGAPVDEDAPACGVLHTIEGSLEGGLAVFRVHFAPHFTLDGQRIIQMIPLGTMASALENRPGGVETNSIARVQIELAGHSNEKPWSCDAATHKNLADLMATLEDAAEIPLERPFPDEMPSPPWATTSFARRGAGKWGHVAGWYGHVEVPENEHWDPGALQWSKLLETAKGMTKTRSTQVVHKPDPDKPPKPIPAWYWHWLNWLLGEGDFKKFGPRNADHRPDDAPKTIPHWAWVKAGQFTAARNEPHGT